MPSNRFTLWRTKIQELQKIIEDDPFVPKISESASSNGKVFLVELGDILDLGINRGAQVLCSPIDMKDCIAFLKAFPKIKANLVSQMKEELGLWKP